MVWTKIKRLEKSQYNNLSSLIIFDYLGEERFSIITDKVLKYLKINELNIGDDIFVIKSFNHKNKPIYLIKKVLKIKNDK